MRLTIEQQHAELGKAVDSTRVKQRKQGGTNVSYVPGWHVIEELNRIFGPDRWSMQTTQLSPKGYKRTKDDKVGSCVTYTAQVELEVIFADGTKIVRSDVGAGSHMVYTGDWGEAAEKASKEAATDALKRAARTLGNTFGLSLYDKDNDVHKGGEDTHGKEIEPPKDSPPPKPNGEKSMAEKVDAIIDEILKMATEIDPDNLPRRVQAWLDEQIKGDIDEADFKRLVGNKSKPGSLVSYGRELREELDKKKRQGEQRSGDRPARGFGSGGMDDTKGT